MKVNEKLSKLRQLMKEKNLDAYIIPSTDPHLSEYVPERWTSRAWISGFTGSAGTVVVTADKSGLWTDSRYFLQGSEQLEGTEIELYKLGMPDVPDYPKWLNDNLKNSSNIGFDGSVYPLNLTKKLEETFELKGHKIVPDYDLIEEIWQDRPEIPRNEIFLHDVKYSGKSTADKLKDVRAEMKDFGADNHLICTLDDIAWLFNVRGTDVAFNPVAVAYALITPNETKLFVLPEKVNSEVKSQLEKDVKINDYHAIGEHIEKIEGTILIDPARTIKSLFDKIPSEVKVIESMNISTKMKGKKNKIEIVGMKNALRRDAVALTEFSMWLEKAIKSDEKITETQAMDRLRECRSKIDLFFGESFNTISGYAGHGAIVHYSATKESEFTIGTDTFFLLDSGGQYYDGTTDITRTFHFGTPTEQEKEDFTRVLKGHIDLAIQKYPAGTRGSQLDAFARKHLWDAYLHYGHGTGHGVGCFLNVHEGPQNIRLEENPTVLEEGMITSNEPGVYRADKYGIRIENLVLTVPDKKSDFAQFMAFDTLTLFPIALNCIKVEMLTEEEKNWLNNYHKKVFDEVSPLLDEEQKLWLGEQTKSI